MYDIPQETYYVMDMLDHSMYRGSEWSLDRIATEVYGRKYIGQQTGDKIANETTHIFDMSEGEVEEWVNGESYYSSYDNDVCLNLEDWLAEPDGQYDWEHARKGPEPQTMLAHLIRDGHLPYGVYLINVSW